MARATVWDGDRGAERERIILEATAKGVSREGAAKMAGISVRTLHNRMADDAEFAERVWQKEASMEQTALDAIRLAWADAKNWTAAAWFLERRYPQNYAKRIVSETRDFESEAHARAVELGVDPETFVAMLLEERDRRVRAERRQLPPGS